MLTIDVLEFLRTGKAGPVSVGSSASSIEVAIGEPEARSLAKGDPKIWRFGRLEIQLRQQVASEIFLSTRRVVRASYPGIKYLNLETWLEADIASVGNALRSLGFQKNLFKGSWQTDQEIFEIAESSVYLVFNEGTLEKIYATR